MKTRKIVTAGPLVVEAIYPRGNAHDAPRVRAGKRKLSSEAQKRLNAKHSFQKLELLLAANFVPGDWIVTFTYDPEHLPKTRAQAVARLKEFRRRLTQRRRARGQELRMVWNAENVFDQGRWHHHAVLNNCGEDFSVLRELWSWGANVEIQTLRIDRDHSFEALARYLCKEARERPGFRCWSYTRSCRQPEVETFAVPDDTPLQPPKGATVYEDARHQNEFGAWRVVKYLAPGWRRSVRRPPRKRRR